MDRHRSLQPAAHKISLENTEVIMNRRVADEPTFKIDTVTLDQEVKGTDRAHKGFSLLLVS